MGSSDRRPHRRRGTAAVYPVVRWDDYGDAPLPIDEVRLRCSITSVFTSWEEAEADAARLNGDGRSQYFPMASRLRNIAAAEADAAPGAASVQWRIHLRARDEAAMRKVTARIAGEIDRAVTVTSSERYRKDGSQQVVLASTPLAADTLQAAVFETLGLATAWSYSWTVNQPEEFPTGQWAFEGWSNGNFRVAGVEFAAFALNS